MLQTPILVKGGSYDAPQAAEYLFLALRKKSMLGGSLVTTAWRILRLRMERSPPGTEGSCEYIE
jgi:hypothetical protein